MRNDPFRPSIPPQMVTTRATTDAAPFFHVVAVDLGSVSDSTAITVLEVARAWEITYSQGNFEPVPAEASRRQELSYTVRHLHRPRLGTSYPAIVEQIAAILEDLPALPERPLLAMDGTGLGGPVVQLARQRGLKPIAITITAGNSATLISQNWSVPKALLVGELRLALHQKRLRVAQGFAARDVLAEELAAFTAKVGPSGRATFEAAGSEHDDTVLSLAMGVFVAKHRPQPIRRVANGAFLAR